jgi:DNA-binding MarR family transcriptional regulator
MSGGRPDTGGPARGDSVDRMIAAWKRRDPSLDTSPLEVVGRLLLCAEHLERMLVRALKPFELSFGDFDVLNTLRRRGDEDGTQPSLLAQSSLITTGAMTARLTRLERAGLIVREADKRDGRAVKVKLTPHGDEIAERAVMAVLAADELFLEPLGSRERDAVASGLRTLLIHRGDRDAYLTE